MKRTRGVMLPRLFVVALSAVFLMGFAAQATAVPTSINIFGLEGLFVTTSGKTVEKGTAVIGAGCVVRQGMKVPAKSFIVGVPGKIRGEASPRQLWWVQEGSPIYNRLAQQYKEEGL